MAAPFSFFNLSRLFLQQAIFPLNSPQNLHPTGTEHYNEEYIRQSVCQVKVDTRNEDSYDILPRQCLNISNNDPHIHNPAEDIAPDETERAFPPQRFHP